MQALHVPTSRRSRLRILAFLAGLAVALISLALTVASPAQASTAHGSTVRAPAVSVVPNSAGPRCGYGSSSGNAYTCITADGSGLHVDAMYASVDVINAGRELQVCIRGPQSSIGCYPGPHSYTFVPAGLGITFQWLPDRNEPAGDYCANTYRDNGNGTNTQIGHECINVHA